MSQYNFFKKLATAISIIILTLVICASCGLSEPVTENITAIPAQETLEAEETTVVETESYKRTENAEVSDSTLSEKEEKLAEEQIKAHKRLLLENQRKEELGIFYVPLPPLNKKDNRPIKAKGIHVTANSAGLGSRF